MVTADYYNTIIRLIFLQSEVDELLASPGIEPSTLDLSSQSGSLDQSQLLK